MSQNSIDNLAGVVLNNRNAQVDNLRRTIQQHPQNIRYLQELSNAVLGLPIDIDGQWGPQTEEAFRMFSDRPAFYDAQFKKFRQNAHRTVPSQSIVVPVATTSGDNLVNGMDMETFRSIQNADLIGNLVAQGALTEAAMLASGASLIGGSLAASGAKSIVPVVTNQRGNVAVDILAPLTSGLGSFQAERVRVINNARAEGIDPNVIPEDATQSFSNAGIESHGLDSNFRYKSTEAPSTGSGGSWLWGGLATGIPILGRGLLNRAARKTEERKIAPTGKGFFRSLWPTVLASGVGFGGGRLSGNRAVRGTASEVFDIPEGDMPGHMNLVLKNNSNDLYSYYRASDGFHTSPRLGTFNRTANGYSFAASPGTKFWIEIEPNDTPNPLAYTGYYIDPSDNTEKTYKYSLRHGDPSGRNESFNLSTLSPDKQKAILSNINSHYDPANAELRRIDMIINSTPQPAADQQDNSTWTPLQGSGKKTEENTLPVSTDEYISYG